MSDAYKTFITYVRDGLDTIPNEVNDAIDYMDKYRCPLAIASNEVIDTIFNAFDDWCTDNDIEKNSVDIFDCFNVYTYEDIFFDALELR